jgi:CHAT domain-containing protein
LGDAKPIADAVAAWRDVIASRGDDRAVASRVRDLLWARIAPLFPANTRTAFLSADGYLARLPWCALPGSKPDSVLLEEFDGGIATVPHGLFLVDQLHPWPMELAARPKTDGLLALGNVAFGAVPSPRYPALPGTAAELRALTPLASGTPTLLDGERATPDRLAAELPRARYAHLATHGFFATTELAAEQERERQLLRDWQEGGVTERRTASQNPLAFVGLALAGANAPTLENPGIATGLTLVDLPLEGLDLCVLSACETGLGGLTGGEGVQGLQRAFHLAGCPNVIASLWNVNDAATAALMAKFYHEMWVNKKEPLAALREAQLTIYSHPELIPDLAGERGAPKLKEAVVVKSGEPRASPSGGTKHADTKLWAAFVLSGVGK